MRNVFHAFRQSRCLTIIQDFHLMRSELAEKCNCCFDLNMAEAATINVDHADLRMMAAHTELYPFIRVSFTLTMFEGHSSNKVAG